MKVSKHTMLSGLLIAAIAFIIYLPSLRNGFTPGWDDGKMILNAPIRSFDLDLLRWTFSAEANDTFGPLYVISFALDYAIWGLNHAGYHLTSVITHCINSALLFIILMQIGEYWEKNLRSKDDRTNIFKVSFVSALLFAVHPLNVSSVAWVSARNGPLSAFFFLGSIYFYLKYAVGKTRNDLYKSIIFFSISSFIKPTVAPLPAVLLLLDHVLLRRVSFRDNKHSSKEIKEVLIEKIPYLVVGLFSLAATFLIRHSSGFVAGTELLPVLLRPFVAIRAMGFYVFNGLLPINLAPIYAYPDKIDILRFEYLGALALAVVVTFLFRRNNMLYRSLWAYYLIMLMPIFISLLVPSGNRRYAEADRYGYLARIGLFCMVGIYISKTIDLYPGKVRNAIITCIFVIFVLLSIRTVDQISIWRDPISLWSHQIRIFPATYEAYINRGSAFERDREYHKALQDYNKAIESGPSYAAGYYNRGNAYFALGEAGKAIRDYSKAIELNPVDADARSNRGDAFYSIRDFKRAIEDQTEAIKINPQNADFYFDRGLAYAGLGEMDKAIYDYSKAIELNPNDADSYFYRAEAYGHKGRYKEAEQDYKMAASLGAQR